MTSCYMIPQVEDSSPEQRFSVRHVCDLKCCMHYPLGSAWYDLEAAILEVGMPV